MDSPGFHSPLCRLCKIKPLICWYKGLKAGACPGVTNRPGLSLAKAVAGGEGMAGMALKWPGVSRVSWPHLILYKT
jgi:hypothetical protein